MRVQNRSKKIMAAIFATSLLFAACRTHLEHSTDSAANQTEIRVSAANVNAAEPAIASDASGNIYVVYVEHGADKTADVFVQKFGADGKLIGEKTRVNPEKGQAKAWFGDAPTIKIGKDNHIFVGWTAKVASIKKPGATVLNLSVSTDGGKTFAAPVKVNDDIEPASHGMHSLEIGRDNQIFMAWLDERNLKTEDAASNRENELPESFQIVKIHHNSNQKQETKKEEKKEEKKEIKHEETEPNSEVFFAASSDGGKTFAANKKLSGEVCPCCKTSITVASNGKTYVSWRQVLAGDFRHIAIASTTDGGESFSAPAIVSDDQWQINACPVSGASMSTVGENALKIVWYTAGRAGNPGLYYAESTDGGKTFSPRAQVTGETVMGFSNILTGGGEKSRVVFSEATNQVVVAANSNGNFSVEQTIKDAEGASATFAGEKLFVAFVRKEGEKQSVWLYRQN